MRVMREIAIDQDWKGNAWRTRTSGDGSVSATAGILTTSSSAGSQSMMDFFVPVLAGMRVEVDVLGQWVSGTAGVYLDAINATGTATLQQLHEITDKNDWRTVSVGYTVPQITTMTFIRVVIGVPSIPAGNAKWQLPVIRIGNGFGAPICIARGLVRMNAGPTVDLHPSFVSHGVTSVAFNGTDTVTVTLEHQLMSSPQNVRPIVQVSGTSDAFVVPVAGAVTAGVTPTFTIKWATGAAFANVSAGGFFAFFSVWL